MTFNELCKSLEEKIQGAYNNGVTLEEAEKLASEFLYAQIQVSTELRIADLDSRMKKSGLKAVRAKIYMDTASGADKKPTEAAIAAIIDTNPLVSIEQNGLDTAEVIRDELERYYNIFLNAHVHFRNVSKGRFE